ncbi:MAG: HdeD family acid-resistance protein [Methylocystis sp.]
MSLSGDSLPPSAHDIGHVIRHLRGRWGWFVGFGVVTVILGIALLTADGLATLISVSLIAAFMILIGGVEISFGFNAPSWTAGIAFVLVGVAYVVAAAFMLANPETGAIGLTLMLGAALLVTGVLRIFFATQLPEGPRLYIGLAGAVTTLLGAFILAGWPANSAYILGIFLGVDMIFYGASWLNFGLFLRPRGPRPV